MGVSIRNTVNFIAIFSICAFAFCNCSNVEFSSLYSAQNNPTPGPSPLPTPIKVTLNPVVNAVAFEDLYFPPGDTPSQLPDYDYNDFLTDFKIQEITNAQNQVTDIYIDFYPRAVGAGYDHIFYLILTGKKTTPSANLNILPTTKPMFQGAAQVTLTYYDAQGNVYGTPSNPPYNQDIVVFKSTHEVFGVSTSDYTTNTGLPNGYVWGSGLPSNYTPALYNARVHVQLDNPALNPAPANGFDSSTFRVILHPIPTNYDIDIINVDPNNFVAGTGNPWGFIIPTDWQWMQESVDIINGYPNITDYQKYLAGQNPACPQTDTCINWFNYPATGQAEQNSLYPPVSFQATNPAIP